MKIDDIKEILNKYADRNAFYIKDSYYTYKDLGQKVSDIKKAVSSELPNLNPKHIGVFIHDDIESYSSCICVLLLGFGYVPLNPLNPIERIIEIIEQADIRVILSSDSSLESTLNLKSSLVFIKTKELSYEPIDLDFPQSMEEDPAYVIFTSGSTGKSKGAPISRGNINAFLDSVSSLDWDISCKDRFLQMSSMTFDMSILTFIIPLCVGACIYTVPEDEIKYLYGYRLMVEQNITFIAVVPSTLSYLKPYFNEISLSNIKYSLVCGEAFPTELANQWAKCVSNANIVNIYGPTESTVFTHSYDYMPNINTKEYVGIVALGNLVKNMEAMIIGENGKEVPIGDKGELCISGKQLTSGYLKNPVKNNESFFNFTIDNVNKRFYKTGDIVFMDEEDCFYYVGRIDQQVKIQGHRVELGDIEKHTRDFIKAERAIALAVKNDLGNTQIHLFVEKNEFSEDALLKFLKSKLPYYMVPSNISCVENMPLNANGKIDRLALGNLVKTSN